MKGGTGVLIDPHNAESQFMDFLKHSNVTYLNNGAVGIAFRVVVRSDETGYQSPYKHLDAFKFQQPVTSLLIKISIIGDDNTELKSFSNETDKDVHLHPINADDFKREVNIQTDIFLKTMEYSKPLCPAIVFSKLYDSTHSNGELLSIIRTQMLNENDQRHIDNITRNNTGYTIIAMEMMTNHVTLHEQLSRHDSNEKKKWVPMLVFMLIELVMKAGYSHGDFHFGNVLVDPTDTSMFHGVTGSMMLIDFGFAVKLTPQEMLKFKRLYADKSYYAFLKKLCATPRADKLIPNQYSNAYHMCGPHLVDHMNNHAIEQLFIQNQQSIDALVHAFNQSHSDILLPFSNAIKHQMFPGLIDQQTSAPVKRIWLTNIATDEKHWSVYKTVCGWIVEVVDDQQRKNLRLKTSIMKDSKYNVQLKSCYITVYLLSLPEFRKRDYFQLAAIVGMYCGGLHVPFEEFETMCVSTYSAEMIKEACLRHNEQLRTVHIVNVSDFIMSEIVTKRPTLIEMISSDLEVFTNPSAYVKKHMEIEDRFEGYVTYKWSTDPINNASTTPEEFEFPFASEGGKQSRRKRGRYTRRKRTNKMNHRSLR